MKKLLLLCLAFIAVTAAPATLLAGSASAAGSNPDFVGQGKCTGSDCVPAQHDPAANPQGCADQGCDIVGKYLNPFIKLLGIGLGLAVTIGIAWGGIEYASSGGDPQKTASGKKHITWAIVVLVLYFFLYALIKFLAPGV